MDSARPADWADHDAIGLALEFARVARGMRSRADRGPDTAALCSLAQRLIGADEVSLALGALGPDDPPGEGSEHRSVMGHALEVNGEILGWMTISSVREHAFTRRETELGEILAAHTAIALYSAGQEERAANLERALKNSRRIGIAVGIVMATRRLSESDALQVLVRHSQGTNRKLADIAEEISYTGVAPA